MDSAETIREKLFDAMNDSKSYSMEDFHEEYTNISHTAHKENSDIFKIPVKFVNKSNNENPSYATYGAAGFDFRADLNNVEITLFPGQIEIIPTGLYFELPLNLEIQVRPRSGLAAKHGITVLNSPGTIDSDYRGEIKVILINHGKEAFTVRNGERIAQGVIANCLAKQMINLNEASELNNNTERGEGGFGSTGIK